MAVSPSLASPLMDQAFARRRSTALPLCLMAGAVVASCFAFQQLTDLQTFVAGTSLQRVQASTIQRSAGFGESSQKKAKKEETVRLSKDDLEALHGDKWELVDPVFKGKKAASPEAIMRARFTALFYKDPQFLAATERDGENSLKRRTENWAKALGLKEEEFLGKIEKMIGGADIENLREIDRFEVLDAYDDQVEFKIYCKSGKVLYEKSTCREDKKFGYIYSGESEFSKWE
eukprot:CAMPEP_0172675008 /NCGR_PEP_ID=MMETSP1074-20121228/13041_1 /TAXON_ID=2916 /ORGANISM="Ceratium fusus, Strain PA161109" /LENGTH=231 /DNA_ID=CAMNT_0013492455 /DNA_START=71 /DNA_END=769 /DNA_ORIENTATION=+